MNCESCESDWSCSWASVRNGARDWSRYSRGVGNNANRCARDRPAVCIDLYCESDPALDIGNFLGHITEQSLRETGTSDALKQVEETLLEHYLNQVRSFSHYAVATYHTLTLVRHISISTQFPERQRTTEPLLELCEARLA